MPCAENLCEHLSEVIDEHQGDVICVDCGLVISRLFIQPIGQHQLCDSEKLKWEYEIKDILDRLHIPTFYSNKIYHEFEKRQCKKTKDQLAFVVYKCLNDIGINLSLSDISNASGVGKTKLYKTQEPNESICLNMGDRSERICGVLGISYKLSTVIKETISSLNLSGHNPLTTIAATIYKVSLENNNKLSMKKVAKASGVSCISIQRYIKSKK